MNAGHVRLLSRCDGGRFDNRFEQARSEGGERERAAACTAPPPLPFRETRRVGDRHERHVSSIARVHPGLQQWASEGMQAENRMEAVRRIHDWLADGNAGRELNLSGLRLRTLPPVLPAGLEHLAADNNKLAALPVSLPETLRYLSVEDNRLARLPERLPTTLKYLHVACNRLDSLPQRLPASLFLLDVAQNRLHALPEGLPAGVKHVYASRNRITCLPCTLPAGLRVLDVEHNRLTGLPASIAALTRCQIDLDHNPIPGRVRERLSVASSSPHYAGPRILLATAPVNEAERVMPLGAAACAWYAASSDAARASIARTWRRFDAEPGAQDFARFLVRLQHSVNGAHVPFNATVREWLGQLAVNPSLRQRTFELAAEACASCEDRVSLAFNDMKKARLVDDVEKGRYDHHLEALISLARGMFRLDQLEGIACSLAGTLRFVDEIEVYLAYQVMLRERLDLPVDTPGMRFFAISYVTDADLARAEAHVKAQEGRDFERYFTTQWGPWQAVLKRLDPTAYDAGQAQIAREKEQLNEQLQAELQQLTDAMPAGWHEQVAALQARFGTGENDIVLRVNRAMTRALFAAQRVPGALLETPWRNEERIAGPNEGRNAGRNAGHAENRTVAVLSAPQESSG